MSTTTQVRANGAANPGHLPILLCLKHSLDERFKLDLIKELNIMIRRLSCYLLLSCPILLCQTVLLARGAIGRGWRLVDRPVGFVDCIVFSSDQTLVGIVEENHEVRIVEFSTGVTRGILKGHTDRIRRVVFSPDGRLVVTSSLDGTLRLWNSRTAAQLHQVAVPQCIDLAFSPDGQTLASGHLDRKLLGLIFWHLPRSTQLVPYKRVAAGKSADGERRIPNRLQFAPDGRKIVFGANSLNVLDLADGAIRTVACPDLDSSIIAYVFVAHEGWLVGATYGSKLVVWDAETLAERFRVVYSLPVPHSRLTSMAHVPRTGKLLTCSEYITLVRWDLKNGRASERSLILKRPAGSQLKNMVQLSDGGSALAVHAEGKVFLYDLTATELLGD